MDAGLIADVATKLGVPGAILVSFALVAVNYFKSQQAREEARETALSARLATSENWIRDTLLEELRQSRGAVQENTAVIREVLEELKDRDHPVAKRAAR